AGATDPWVRDVAVAPYFVRGVHDHNPLALLVSQQSRTLAKHRGLADARSSEEQYALTTFDDVAEDLGRPGDRTADPARQTDYAAAAVADGRDAGGRPVLAGPGLLPQPPPAAPP